MFFPLSFMKDSFTRYRILGWQLFFFLSAFWMYHFTAFSPLLYLMISQLLILLGQRAPCTWWVFLFLLFSRFLLSLSFSLTMMWLVIISLCLSYSLYVEFLVSVKSCFYLIKLFTFSDTFISKNILLPLSLSLFSLWEFHHIYVGELAIDSQVSEVLFHFPQSLFSLFFSFNNYYLSIWSSLILLKSSADPL